MKTLTKTNLSDQKRGSDKMACQLIVFKASSDGVYYFIGSDGHLYRVGPWEPDGPGGMPTVQKKMDELLSAVKVNSTLMKLSTEQLLTLKQSIMDEINIVFAKKPPKKLTL
jgi:hypothetical protein